MDMLAPANTSQTSSPRFNPIKQNHTMNKTTQTQKEELFGGPHDGLIIHVSKSQVRLAFPIGQSTPIEEGIACIPPTLPIDTYQRTGITQRFKYHGTRFTRS